MVLNLTKLESLHPRCIVPSLIEICHVIMEKNLKFLNFESRTGSSFEQISPKDILCQVWLKRPSGSREDDF